MNPNVILTHDTPIADFQPTGNMKHVNRVGEGLQRNKRDSTGDVGLLYPRTDVSHADAMLNRNNAKKFIARLQRLTAHFPGMPLSKPLDLTYTHSANLRVKP